jgi:hypothetical protein
MILVITLSSCSITGNLETDVYVWSFFGIVGVGLLVGGPELANQLIAQGTGTTTNSTGSYETLTDLDSEVPNLSSVDTNESYKDYSVDIVYLELPSYGCPATKNIGSHDIYTNDGEDIGFYSILLLSEREPSDISNDIKCYINFEITIYLSGNVKDRCLEADVFLTHGGQGQAIKEVLVRTPTGNIKSDRTNPENDLFIYESDISPSNPLGFDIIFNVMSEDMCT